MTPVRQRMTEDMQVRNLSPHTQASYVQQVSLFARYFGKSPEVLGPRRHNRDTVMLRHLVIGTIEIRLRCVSSILRHPAWEFSDYSRLSLGRS